MTLDPRLYAFRPNLADAALRGQVEADHYAEARPGAVSLTPEGVTDMLASPEIDAARTTQLITGEALRVFDVADGFAWCQNVADGYVGYIRENAVTFEAPPATHNVIASRSFVYAQASIKSPVIAALPFSAQLTPADEDDTTADLAPLANGGGHVFRRHIAPYDTQALSPREVLKRFDNVPYLWGGRSTFGVDCSALVQFACAAAGIAAPRDSDQQAASPVLGAPLAAYEPEAITTGDLVFWKGHVGIMVSDTELCHANGYHMQVVTEPLADAVERIKRLYAHPTGFRKLDLFNVA